MIAAVLGGANCVWDDLAALRALTKVDVIIATNDAGAHFAEPVDHWVTLHAEKLSVWMGERAQRGYPPASRVWVHDRAPRTVPGIDGYDKLADWGGSSGLFAVQVALSLGLERVVLCGVPMEGTYGHFFDPGRWQWAVRYRSAWQQRIAFIAETTRSMSGWTAEILGKPDEVWLSKE